MAALENLKSMRIGVDNVVVAILKQDTTGTDPKVLYGDQTNTEGKKLTKGIFALPGVQALNINPNMSLEVAFFDDGPGDVASTLGAIEVSFTKSSLSPKEKSLLLGKKAFKIGDKSGVVSSSNDIPPWVAIGFRTLRSDGTYRYVWLLKGKFMEPEDNNETKGDSINFQSEEIVGRFVKTNKEFEVTNKDHTGSGSGKVKINPWKVEAESNDTSAATLIEKWFDAPILPGVTPSNG
ncbi:MAG: major tail protein [Paraclostridium sp.]